MKAGQKINQRKTRPDRTTWTIDPGKEVLAAIATLTGGRELDRGERTALIKKALMHQYPGAFKSVLQKKVDDAQRDLDELLARMPSSEEEKALRRMGTLALGEGEPGSSPESP